MNARRSLALLAVPALLVLSACSGSDEPIDAASADGIEDVSAQVEDAQDENAAEDTEAEPDAGTAEPNGATCSAASDSLAAVLDGFSLTESGDPGLGTLTCAWENPDLGVGGMEGIGAVSIEFDSSTQNSPEDIEMLLSVDGTTALHSDALDSHDAVGYVYGEPGSLEDQPIVQVIAPEAFITLAAMATWEDGAPGSWAQYDSLAVAEMLADLIS